MFELPPSTLQTILQLIVNSHFVKENYCTVIYYDRNLRDAARKCDRYCEFLESVEWAFQSLENGYNSVIWISEDSFINLENAIENGCQSYIVATRNIAHFFDLKMILKNKSKQRIRDKNILVFDEYGSFPLTDVQKEEVLKFFPNLWFMVPSDGNFNFFTHDYSRIPGEIYLGNVFNVTRNEFTSLIPIFYDKLFNLEGRTLQFASTEYLPYCVMSNVGAHNGNADMVNSTLKNELYLEGLEGTLAVEFCRMRNCSLQVTPFGPSDWGDIYENGSGYGAIYSIYTNRTEFGLCCLYYNWFLDILDGSQYTVKSTITTLVPAAKLLPTFLTVIYPFSKALWVAIAIMLVIMTAVHHIITTLNRKHSSDRDAPEPPIEKSIFDMISIYLDQGIFPNSVSSSYRILIAFILLSGVVLSNSYAGALACVLTVPRFEKSIETIHEFVSSPYRWGAPAIAWILSLFGANSSDIKGVINKFDLSPDEEWLYQQTLTGQFGVGVELLNGGNYAFGSFVRRDNVHSFEILSEEFYFTYTIGYSQRGWPLMEYFNKFNLEAIQFGFMTYWEREALRKYADNVVEQALLKAASKQTNSDELAPLTMNHILSPLIILGAGTFGAFLIFVVELMWKQVNPAVLRCYNRVNRISKMAF
ncbi:uncharacterized protein LOC129742976 [Uranotaenia lowii]|uniref:uncharacterized protein LOC129742976 n=1 Tax=Uranotaenia lowii TaxID=190385 RepID=UPI002479CBA3|nr:uncharacterized protein LOC129742976 [Uranotaenia lowii]